MPSLNWGDAVGPILAEIISGERVNSVNGSMKTNGYAFVGSILNWVNGDNIEVCGVGFSKDGLKINCGIKKIHSTRGPLTKRRLDELGIPSPEIYGDPVLLYPKYYSPNIEKKYKLGVIPHYVDKNNPVLNKFKGRDDVKIINIMRSDKDMKNHSFINEVLECENIISSSLHGIILADAYNIPTGWVELSDNVIGEGFKFRDYFLSVKKTDLTPLQFNNNTTYENLLNKINNEKIDIDLDLLLRSIPFYNK